ncbi:MAG: HVO_0234 family beta-propeller protein, partial [Natrialbaceae archaeon]
GKPVAGDWETVGEVAGPRRFDGATLAAESGVFRVGDGIEDLGLTGVRDVAGNGSLAATADGLYRREGDGWERVIGGDAAAVVESDGAAYAVVDGGVFERSGGSDGGWSQVSIPGDSPAVDIAYGRELAVITAEGTVHVEADPERTHDGHGGWRSQALGLRDVTGFVALV